MRTKSTKIVIKIFFYLLFFTLITESNLVGQPVIIITNDNQRFYIPPHISKLSSALGTHHLNTEVYAPVNQHDLTLILPYLEQIFSSNNKNYVEETRKHVTTVKGQLKKKDLQTLGRIMTTAHTLCFQQLLIYAAKIYTEKLKNIATSSTPEAFLAHMATISPETKHTITNSILKLTESCFLKRVCRHGCAVSDVCFSPAGTTLATAADDCTACLWEVKTGKQLRIFPHNQEVKSVTFGPTNTIQTTSYTSNTGIYHVKTWDIKTGNLLSEKEDDKPNILIQFNQTKTQVATRNTTDTKKVSIWDRRNGKKICEPCHADEVSSFSFHPYNAIIATASWDKTARSWDIETGKQLSVFPHENTVTSVHFNHTGTKLATASCDDTAQIWNSETGESLLTLPHSGWVTSVRFGPIDTILVTGSANCTAQIWDLDPLLQIQELCKTYPLDLILGIFIYLYATQKKEKLPLATAPSFFESLPDAIKKILNQHKIIEIT